MNVNDLNSILLEGHIAGVVKDTCDSVGSRVCEFTIVSCRYFKQEKDKVNKFYITTHGRLAEFCAEYLTAGKGVRVVGRLEQDMGGVIIIAEHVEFKPEKKKK